MLQADGQPVTDYVLEDVIPDDETGEIVESPHYTHPA